jgi:hypothetical protein
MRTNADKLPIMGLQGQPKHPAGSNWQVSHQGEPFCEYRTGGITYNVKVGDSAMGWAADHTEPGVSCQAGKGGTEDPNLAFNVFSCVGNLVSVLNGDAKGGQGIVTGKHGGAENLMVDFPDEVLEKLSYDDKLLVRGVGQGLKLLDYPGIYCTNLDPGLLAKMRIVESDGKLHVPVAAKIPCFLMGSGIGSTTPFRGDYDVQTSERAALAEHGLLDLKLGDFVAITDHAAAHGWSYKRGGIVIGIIVHGDSYKAGHGPGISSLLTCSDGTIVPELDPAANISRTLNIGRARSSAP